MRPESTRRILHKTGGKSGLRSNCVVSNSHKDVDFLYYDNPNLAAVSAVGKTLTPALTKQYYDPNTDNDWMREQQERYLRRMTVKPRTLTEIVQQSGLQRIGFFSLDVEGHEFEVLLSYDWRISIEFILVEENKDTRVDSLLLNQNYTLVETIHNNNLYARS